MIETLELRNVTLEDARLLFEWQIAPETRRYFFNASLPTWNEHETWIKKSLVTGDRILLLAVIEEDPIGVLRLDLKADQAEISIYLKPGLAGNGWGATLLKKGINWFSEHFPQRKKITAKILPENKVAQRAFEKAGFRLSYLNYEREI